MPSARGRRFYKSMLYPLLRRINDHLVRCAMRKYRRLRRREQRARELMAEASRRSPRSHRAGRASEGVIVAISGVDNITRRSEGPLLRPCLHAGRSRCMAARPNNTLVKTRVLQHKLYLAAKRSPNRRFHALYDRISRRDVLRRAWLESAKRCGKAGPGWSTPTSRASSTGSGSISY